MTQTQTLFELLDESLKTNTFVKITLGNYVGQEEGLKQILVKKATIKRQELLSFTYRYKTRDIVKNNNFEAGIALLKTLASPSSFRYCCLFTTSGDWVLEIKHEQRATLKQQKPTAVALPSLEHDKPKNRVINATTKPYLQQLNIIDGQGNVFKNTQDKFKQINHYIEILSSLLKELPKKQTLKVVDMGAGKGYLTFALYDYLTNALCYDVEMVGVEFRNDLVLLCNKIAQNSNFKKLRFEQNTIEAYQSPDIDVLIALHACDTATDDAMAKGIRAKADLIVVAPCCHKQIRKEMEKHKTKNDLDFLLKHGIFLERQAEMLTDGLRALILQYFGYSTKVFEFVSDAHTPKNVLIVGRLNKQLPLHNKAILEKIKSTKAFFGIQKHYLERVLGLLTD